MWRNNRNTNGHKETECQGVDLNRNFDFHWDQSILIKNNSNSVG